MLSKDEVLKGLKCEIGLILGLRRIIWMNYVSSNHNLIILHKTFDNEISENVTPP